MLENITYIIFILFAISWVFYGLIIVTFMNRQAKSKRGYPLFYNIRYFNCNQVTENIEGCNRKSAKSICYACKYSTYAFLIIIGINAIVSILN